MENDSISDNELFKLKINKIIFKGLEDYIIKDIKLQEIEINSNIFYLYFYTLLSSNIYSMGYKNNTIDQPYFKVIPQKFDISNFNDWGTKKDLSNNFDLVSNLFYTGGDYRDDLLNDINAENFKKKREIVTVLTLKTLYFDESKTKQKYLNYSSSFYNYKKNTTLSSLSIINSQIYNSNRIKDINLNYVNLTNLNDNSFGNTEFIFNKKDSFNEIIDKNTISFSEFNNIKNFNEYLDNPMFNNNKLSQYMGLNNNNNFIKNTFNINSPFIINPISEIAVDLELNKTKNFFIFGTYERIYNGKKIDVAVLDPDQISSQGSDQYEVINNLFSFYCIYPNSIKLNNKKFDNSQFNNNTIFEEFPESVSFNDLSRSNSIEIKPFKVIYNKIQPQSSQKILLDYHDSLSTKIEYGGSVVDSIRLVLNVPYYSELIIISNKTFASINTDSSNNIIVNTLNESNDTIVFGNNIQSANVYVGENKIMNSDEQTLADNINSSFGNGLVSSKKNNWTNFSGKYINYKLNNINLTTNYQLNWSNFLENMISGNNINIQILSEQLQESCILFHAYSDFRGIINFYNKEENKLSITINKSISSTQKPNYLDNIFTTKRNLYNLLTNISTFSFDINTTLDFNTIFFNEQNIITPYFYSGSNFAENKGILNLRNIGFFANINNNSLNIPSASNLNSDFSNNKSGRILRLSENQQAGGKFNTVEESLNGLSELLNNKHIEGINIVSNSDSILLNILFFGLQGIRQNVKYLDLDKANLKFQGTVINNINGLYININKEIINKSYKYNEDKNYFRSTCRSKIPLCLPIFITDIINDIGELKNMINRFFLLEYIYTNIDHYIYKINTLYVDKNGDNIFKNNKFIDSDNVINDLNTNFNYYNDIFYNLDNIDSIPSNTIYNNLTGYKKDINDFSDINIDKSRNIIINFLISAKFIRPSAFKLENAVSSKKSDPKNYLISKNPINYVTNIIYGAINNSQAISIFNDSTYTINNSTYTINNSNSNYFINSNLALSQNNAVFYLENKNSINIDPTNTDYIIENNSKKPIFSFSNCDSTFIKIDNTQLRNPFEAEIFLTNLSTPDINNFNFDTTNPNNSTLSNTTYSYLFYYNIGNILFGDNYNYFSVFRKIGSTNDEITDFYNLLKNLKDNTISYPYLNIRMSKFNDNNIDNSNFNYLFLTKFIDLSQNDFKDPTKNQQLLYDLFFEKNKITDNSNFDLENSPLNDYRFSLNRQYRIDYRYNDFLRTFNGDTNGPKAFSYINYGNYDIDNINIKNNIKNYISVLTQIFNTKNLYIYIGEMMNSSLDEPKIFYNSNIINYKTIQPDIILKNNNNNNFYNCLLQCGVFTKDFTFDKFNIFLNYNFISYKINTISDIDNYFDLQEFQIKNIIDCFIFPKYYFNTNTISIPKQLPPLPDFDGLIYNKECIIDLILGYQNLNEINYISFEKLFNKEINSKINKSYLINNINYDFLIFKLVNIDPSNNIIKVEDNNKNIFSFQNKIDNSSSPPQILFFSEKDTNYTILNVDFSSRIIKTFLKFNNFIDLNNTLQLKNNIKYNNIDLSIQLDPKFDKNLSNNKYILIVNTNEQFNMNVYDKYDEPNFFGKIYPNNLKDYNTENFSNIFTKLNTFTDNINNFDSNNNSFIYRNYNNLLLFKPFGYYYNDNINDNIPTNFGINAINSGNQLNQNNIFTIKNNLTLNYNKPEKIITNTNSVIYFNYYIYPNIYKTLNYDYTNNILKESNNFEVDKYVDKCHFDYYYEFINLSGNINKYYIIENGSYINNLGLLINEIQNFNDYSTIVYNMFPEKNINERIGYNIIYKSKYDKFPNINSQTILNNLDINILDIKKKDQSLNFQQYNIIYTNKTYKFNNNFFNLNIYPINYDDSNKYINKIINDNFNSDMQVRSEIFNNIDSLNEYFSLYQYDFYKDEYIFLLDNKIKNNERSIGNVFNINFNISPEDIFTNNKIYEFNNYFFNYNNDSIVVIKELNDSSQYNIVFDKTNKIINLNDSSGNKAYLYHSLTSNSEYNLLFENNLILSKNSNELKFNLLSINNKIETLFSIEFTYEDINNIIDIYQIEFDIEFKLKPPPSPPPPPPPPPPEYIIDKFFINFYSNDSTSSIILFIDYKNNKNSVIDYITKKQSSVIKSVTIKGLIIDTSTINFSSKPDNINFKINKGDKNRIIGINNLASNNGTIINNEDLIKPIIDNKDIFTNSINFKTYKIYKITTTFDKPIYCNINFDPIIDSIKTIDIEYNCLYFDIGIDTNFLLNNQGIIKNDILEELSNNYPQDSYTRDQCSIPFVFIGIDNSINENNISINYNSYSFTENSLNKSFEYLYLNNITDPNVNFNINLNTKLESQYIRNDGTKYSGDIKNFILISAIEIENLEEDISLNIDQTNLKKTAIQFQSYSNYVYNFQNINFKSQTSKTNIKNIDSFLIPLYQNNIKGGNKFIFTIKSKLPILTENNYINLNDNPIEKYNITYKIQKTRDNIDFYYKYTFTIQVQNESIDSSYLFFKLIVDKSRLRLYNEKKTDPTTINYYNNSITNSFDTIEDISNYLSKSIFPPSNKLNINEFTDINNKNILYTSSDITNNNLSYLNTLIGISQNDLSSNIPFNIKYTNTLLKDPLIKNQSILNNFFILNDSTNNILITNKYSYTYNKDISDISEIPIYNSFLEYNKNDQILDFAYLSEINNFKIDSITNKFKNSFVFDNAFNFNLENINNTANDLVININSLPKQLILNSSFIDSTNNNILTKILTFSPDNNNKIKINYNLNQIRLLLDTSNFILLPLKNLVYFENISNIDIIENQINNYSIDSSNNIINNIDLYNLDLSESNNIFYNRLLCSEFLELYSNIKSNNSYFKLLNNEYITNIDDVYYGSILQFNINDSIILGPTNKKLKIEIDIDKTNNYSIKYRGNIINNIINNSQTNIKETNSIIISDNENNQSDKRKPFQNLLIDVSGNIIYKFYRKNYINNSISNKYLTNFFGENKDDDNNFVYKFNINDIFLTNDLNKDIIIYSPKELNINYYNDKSFNPNFINNEYIQFIIYIIKSNDTLSVPSESNIFISNDSYNLRYENSNAQNFNILNFDSTDKLSFTPINNNQAYPPSYIINKFNIIDNVFTISPDLSNVLKVNIDKLIPNINNKAITIITTFKVLKNNYSEINPKYSFTNYTKNNFDTEKNNNILKNVKMLGLDYQNQSKIYNNFYLINKKFLINIFGSLDLDFKIFTRKFINDKGGSNFLSNAIPIIYNNNYFDIVNNDSKELVSYSNSLDFNSLTSFNKLRGNFPNINNPKYKYSSENLIIIHYLNNSNDLLTNYPNIDNINFTTNIFPYYNFVNDKNIYFDQPSKSSNIIDFTNNVNKTDFTNVKDLSGNIITSIAKTTESLIGCQLDVNNYDNVFEIKNFYNIYFDEIPAPGLKFQNINEVTTTTVNNRFLISENNYFNYLINLNYDIPAPLPPNFPNNLKKLNTKKNIETKNRKMKYPEFTWDLIYTIRDNFLGITTGSFNKLFNNNNFFDIIKKSITNPIPIPISMSTFNDKYDNYNTIKLYNFFKSSYDKNLRINDISGNNPIEITIPLQTLQSSKTNVKNDSDLFLVNFLYSTNFVNNINGVPTPGFNNNVEENLKNIVDSYNVYYINIDQSYNKIVWNLFDKSNPIESNSNCINYFFYNKLDNSNNVVTDWNSAKESNNNNLLVKDNNQVDNVKNEPTENLLGFQFLLPNLFDTTSSNNDWSKLNWVLKNSSKEPTLIDVLNNNNISIENVDPNFNFYKVLDNSTQTKQIIYNIISNSSNYIDNSNLIKQGLFNGFDKNQDFKDDSIITFETSQDNYSKTNNILFNKDSNDNYIFNIKQISKIKDISYNPILVTISDNDSKKFEELFIKNNAITRYFRESNSPKYPEINAISINFNQNNSKLFLNFTDIVTLKKFNQPIDILNSKNKAYVIGCNDGYTNQKNLLLKNSMDYYSNKKLKNLPGQNKTLDKYILNSNNSTNCYPNNSLNVSYSENKMKIIAFDIEEKSIDYLNDINIKDHMKRISNNNIGKDSSILIFLRPDICKEDNIFKIDINSIFQGFPDYEQIQMNNLIDNFTKDALQNIIDDYNNYAVKSNSYYRIPCNCVCYDNSGNLNKYIYTNSARVPFVVFIPDPKNYKENYNKNYKSYQNNNYFNNFSPSITTSPTSPNIIDMSKQDNFFYAIYDLYYNKNTNSSLLTQDFYDFYLGEVINKFYNDVRSGTDNNIAIFIGSVPNINFDNSSGTVNYIIDNKPETLYKKIIIKNRIFNNNDAINSDIINISLSPIGAVKPLQSKTQFDDFYSNITTKINKNLTNGKLTVSGFQQELIKKKDFTEKFDINISNYNFGNINETINFTPISKTTYSSTPNYFFNNKDVVYIYNYFSYNFNILFDNNSTNNYKLITKLPDDYIMEKYDKNKNKIYNINNLNIGTIKFIINSIEGGEVLSLTDDGTGDEFLTIQSKYLNFISSSSGSSTYPLFYDLSNNNLYGIKRMKNNSIIFSYANNLSKQYNYLNVGIKNFTSIDQAINTDNNIIDSNILLNPYTYDFLSIKFDIATNNIDEIINNNPEIISEKECEDLCKDKSLLDCISIEPKTKIFVPNNRQIVVESSEDLNKIIFVRSENKQNYILNIHNKDILFIIEKCGKKFSSVFNNEIINYNFNSGLEIYENIFYTIYNHNILLKCKLYRDNSTKNIILEIIERLFKIKDSRYYWTFNNITGCKYKCFY